MTIAGKINVLVVALAVLLVVVVLAVAAQREYRLEREWVITGLKHTVGDRADLPLLIYSENEPRLDRFLDAILKHQAVSEGTVLDAFGEQIMSRLQPEVTPNVRPSFNRLRQDLFALDSGELVLDKVGRVVRDGWYAALLQPDRTIHLSLPVDSSYLFFLHEPQ